MSKLQIDLTDLPHADLLQATWQAARDCGEDALLADRLGWMMRDFLNWHQSLESQRDFVKAMRKREQQRETALAKADADYQRPAPEGTVSVREVVLPGPSRLDDLLVAALGELRRGELKIRRHGVDRFRVKLFSLRKVEDEDLLTLVSAAKQQVRNRLDDDERAELFKRAQRQADEFEDQRRDQLARFAALWSDSDDQPKEDTHAS